MRAEVLRMENITYEESGIVFLEDFSLNIMEGEIMGFIPIDDHGLSAFLDLLQHKLPLRDGFIYYNEKLVNSWRHSRKDLNRISVIHDRSCLVDGLTVADNIFVLRPNAKSHIMHPGLFQSQLAPFLDDIGINIPIDCYVENLTQFERVVVEILKAVVCGYQLIVLSELSTLISDSELTKLHAIMRHYVQRGTSFLYICHHFEEALQICESAAILVNGHITKVLRGPEMKVDVLIEYTREYDEPVYKHLKNKKQFTENDTSLFTAEPLSQNFFGGLSFSVRKGECLVIQSLNKRIDEDLLKTYYGEGPRKDCSFFLEGRQIDFCRNRDIAIVQEIPTTSMLFPELSVFDNLCITIDHRMPGIWHASHVRNSIHEEYRQKFGENFFQKSIDDLDEKQKIHLVYERIRLQKPKVVFVIQPFKREDMVHRLYIWEQLSSMVRSEIAVVIIALNLADSLSLADRLIRIDSANNVIEYSQRDFADIPIIAPWLYLYK